MNLHVATAGMGVNTVAYLILCTNKGIKFDHILFSDPGDENPETYKYISYFNKWLKEHGQPKIKVLFKRTRDGKKLTLYNDNITLKSLPSIVYGYKKCSLKYKVAPFEKFMNNDKLAIEAWKGGSQVFVYKGIDCDEDHRAIVNPNPKFTNVYPLISAEFGRFDCIKYIIDNGLKVPPKSSCTFCPSMKPYEIIELYETNRPAFYKAINMERNAKENLLTIKGLGRDFSWWELIVAYRYFKFVKRNLVANVVMTKRVKRMISKINRSIDGTKKAPYKIKSQLHKKEVAEVICDLFSVKVGESCECRN